MKALKSIANFFTRKKIDQDTKYRLEYKDKLWHLMYKTSTAVVWRSFQNYIDMKQAMEDKAYFESLNTNR
jgi:hypothetical protein